MKRLLFSIMLLFFISGISVSVSGAETEPVKDPVYYNPAKSGLEPQYGGILRVIRSRSPRNLGYPAQSGTTGRSEYIEPLTLFDDKGNLIPLLATSWELDPEAKTMTFKFRKGVKFHDGTDFNAEAAKWNWEQNMSYGRIQGATDVTSIDVLDEHTARVNFSRFSALYVFSFTHCVPQFSPTAVKKNGKEWAMAHAVGTGPFKQADFKDGSYLKLERNENYWGPKPYLDGIHDVFIRDPTVAQLTMVKGDADFWDWADVRTAMSMIKDGFQVKTRRAMIDFIAMDNSSPDSIFNDIRVREAVWHSIDVNAIAKARGFGAARPLTQFATPADIVYNPNVPVREFNPEKSKKLLAEAGYPRGIKTKLLCNNDQATMDICTLIQSYLAMGGINVELDPADRARRLSIVGSAGTGWTNHLVFGGTGVNAGLDFVRWTLSNTFRVQEKSLYRSVLRTPEWTALYDKVVTVPTLDEAKELGKHMVMQLWKEAAVMPLYTYPYINVMQTYVHSNFLDAHHMIWSPELDWMEKH